MGELRDIELLCHWEVRPLNPDGDDVQSGRGIFFSNVSDRRHSWLYIFQR